MKTNFSVLLTVESAVNETPLYIEGYNLYMKDYTPSFTPTHKGQHYLLKLKTDLINDQAEQSKAIYTALINGDYVSLKNEQQNRFKVSRKLIKKAKLYLDN